MEIASIPITTCSKEHQQIYQEWFNYADADTDGRITSNDATKFFAMSNLSRQDLKQVWAITDSKRQGYLGFKEFIAAMQLVSLAQAGHAVTHDLLNSDVDLSSLKPPVMEGLDALIAKKKRKEKTSELESNGSLHGPSPSANWFSSKSAKNSRNPKSQTHAVLISIDAKEDPRLGFTVVVSYLHEKAKPTRSSSPLTPKKIHQKAKPTPTSSPPKSQTHAVLISIDAKEDPRLGFTVVVSHLRRQHSKIEPEIELLSPATHHLKIQMSDTMHDDIDDGLRFRNCNCFCGLKASVKISDMRNENRYRLFQCCPKDACRFFQWCIPLKTPLSYAEDFQQLQEELCVLREELRVIHDKVHPLDQPKKMAKIRFIAWCLFCTVLALLLTMTMV
uniref:Uncharacterized protein n=1 Tax=Quercus lobata TaxID=97700 RepID=A0A7N2M915_QUELO